MELQVSKEWLWKYYTYCIHVYDVWTQKMQTFSTTDPYSRSLAADGARSQVSAIKICLLTYLTLEMDSCIFSLHLNV